jgi:thymidylate kinase
MKLKSNLFKNEKIIIIEGITGSGKDSIQKNLDDEYAKKGFIVYSFSEEELLFSWKHLWIKNIDLVKIKYWHLLLDYIEELIKNEKTMVILNRFHISFKAWAKFDKETRKEYDLLIKKLKKLPIKILILTIDKEEIETKANHIERKELVFQIHRKKRLEASGCKTFKELYDKEQKEYIRIAKNQRLPYEILEFRKEL